MSNEEVDAEIDKCLAMSESELIKYLQTRLAEQGQPMHASDFLGRIVELLDNGTLTAK